MTPNPMHGNPHHVKKAWTCACAFRNQAHGAVPVHPRGCDLVHTGVAGLVDEVEADPLREEPLAGRWTPSCGRPERGPAPEVVPAHTPPELVSTRHAAPTHRTPQTANEQQPEQHAMQRSTSRPILEAERY
eukprot:3479388-Rhodomonas_salina.3